VPDDLLGKVSFALPAYLEHDIPPVPDLDDPRAYAQWRDECLEIRRIPRSVIAELLESVGTDIALFRASLVLGNATAVHATSEALLEQALLRGRKVVHQLAKCLRAHRHASNGFAGTANRQVIAMVSKTVLDGILGDLTAITNWTPLHFELEVRVHSALAEANALSGDHASVVRHSSEVVLLAPSVGLSNLVASALYQIAEAHYGQGEIGEAVLRLDALVALPSVSSQQINNAIIFRALCHYWVGNESASVATLEAAESGLQHEYAWLRHQTLRFGELDESASAPVENAVAIAIKIFSDAVIREGQFPPEYTDEIQNLYRGASAGLRSLRPNFPSTWLGTFVRFIEVYIALRSGKDLLEMELPLEVQPSLLTSMPPAAKTLALAVTIEACAHDLRSPRLIGLLGAALDGLVASLSDLKKSDDLKSRDVLDQLSRKLQLLCPTALALAAFWDKVPRAARELGSEAIMDLRKRPIMVYGATGVRPTQAATATLEAFGFESPLPASRGGSQHLGRQQALYRRYYERMAWFRPVAPARLIAVFLVARDVAEHRNPQRFQAFNCAAASIHRAFGITPRMQQTDSVEALTILEEVLMAGLDHTLDGRFAKLINK
jgi:hypothetical protein